MCAELHFIKHWMSSHFSSYDGPVVWPVCLKKS